MQIESINSNRTGDLLMNLLTSSRVQTAKKLFATITLTVGLGFGLSAPVQAQVPPMPCQLYLCMAGMSGVGLPGGAGCVASYTYWITAAPLGLAVYDETGFDAPASYAARLAFMEGCTQGNVGTNAEIFQTIMEEWGESPVLLPF